MEITNSSREVWTLWENFIVSTKVSQGDIKSGLAEVDKRNLIG